MKWGGRGLSDTMVIKSHLNESLALYRYRYLSCGR